MQITGTIVHQDLEGGFWGIQGDDGVPYRPVNGLPKDYEKAGLRVKATVSPSNALSIHMWGRSVDLQNIAALPTTD